MKAVICLTISALWLTTAAPPNMHRQFLPHPSAQLNTLDYYLDNPDEQRYYSAQQKQGQANAESNGAPSRLENADPNTEVELVPGFQSPQQPPQQNPVYPQVPGVAPGQRVFIVHMPIPGYRPGTIGGYQPVYIVAAAPQGNAGYPDGSYLQDPGQAPFYYRGQGQVNPALVPQGQVNPNYYIGQQGQALNPGLLVPQGQNPGFLAVSPQGQNLGLLFGPAPLILNHQQDRAVTYQQVQNPLPNDGRKGPVRLAQLTTLQGQVQHPKTLASKEVQPSAEPKRDDEVEESKESSEPRRNARPGPQGRAKA